MQENNAYIQGAHKKTPLYKIAFFRTDVCMF